jgi:hypothetical protein
MDASMGDYIVELEKLNVDKAITESLRQISNDCIAIRTCTLMAVFEEGEDTILLGIVTSAVCAMFRCSRKYDEKTIGI